jgi:hypothetical protein
MSSNWSSLIINIGVQKMPLMLSCINLSWNGRGYLINTNNRSILGGMISLASLYFSTIGRLKRVERLKRID